MPQPPTNKRDFSALVEVVKALRGPDGCPWDKEQTHKTLAAYAIEEAFELAEALDTQDPTQIRDELGDYLLQVVLNAEIARQQSDFDIFDVIENLNEKMIRRHPHVFADVKVSSSDDVLAYWQKIKQAEKKNDHVFDIPKGLPALQRSQKIGGKTKKHNFDWQKPSQVMKKVEEEIKELKAAMKKGRRQEVEHELGDLLFSVAQLARHLKIDSEQALRRTNTRFETRFQKMRELAKRDQKDFNKLTQAQLEKYWAQVKKIEKGNRR